MPAHQIFKGWLRCQQKRDDAIGHLAGDYIWDVRNNGKLSIMNTLGCWRRYLNAFDACEEAYNALDKAWSEYTTSIHRL